MALLQLSQPVVGLESLLRGNLHFDDFAYLVIFRCGGKISTLLSKNESFIVNEVTNKFSLGTVFEFMVKFRVF